MIFFYMLVFNLGYLPNLPLASAGYGCGSGCCDKDSQNQCTIRNDEECTNCYDECGPDCQCHPIIPVSGACEYFDSCKNGKVYPALVIDCPSCSGLCNNNVCSNTYESTCFDQTALCHVKLQCS